MRPLQRVGRAVHRGLCSSRASGHVSLRRTGSRSSRLASLGLLEGLAGCPPSQGTGCGSCVQVSFNIQKYTQKDTRLFGTFLKCICRADPRFGQSEARNATSSLGLSAKSQSEKQEGHNDNGHGICGGKRLKNKSSLQKKGVFPASGWSTRGSLGMRPRPHPAPLALLCEGFVLRLHTGTTVSAILPFSRSVRKRQPLSPTLHWPL